ncbi:MAG: aldo/keto reductase [Lutibacter sp.]
MISKQINLKEDLNLSRIIQGHWRLADWKLTSKELLALTQQTIDLGITTFDHADIYGDYSCESIFGAALNLNSSLRSKIQLISKCGILLTSKKFPKRTFKYYDYSFNHIIDSVNQSLKNLKTDYLDVLLLHRPSPFFKAEEVANAFSYLKKEGKVRYFGVSNFSIVQFQLLQQYVDAPLVTNQIEISPYQLEHFENGNIDFLQTQKIKPMAWSPLAGGAILKPNTAQEQRIYKALKEVGEALSLPTVDAVAYSWLLSHPSQILPIIGTHKIERIKHAIVALNKKMTAAQWLKIYIAITGKELP